MDSLTASHTVRRADASGIIIANKEASISEIT
jgi:hypothetical protein